MAAGTGRGCGCGAEGESAASEGAATGAAALGGRADAAAPWQWAGRAAAHSCSASRSVALRDSAMAARLTSFLADMDLWKASAAEASDRKPTVEAASCNLSKI